LLSSHDSREHCSRGYGNLSCSKKQAQAGVLSWQSKLLQTSTSRGQRLTYLAQPALAGCSSALASAPPVAPPNLCLLPAALPLLPATCPAVLRWLASRLKWCAGQTAAALSAEPECLAAPLASVGCLLQHPATPINTWHSSIGKRFIGRSSKTCQHQPKQQRSSFSNAKILSTACSSQHACRSVIL